MSEKKKTHPDRLLGTEVTVPKLEYLDSYKCRQLAAVS
jgi:hypothetical protein